MNQKVSPVTASLILFVPGLFLVAAFYFNQQALTVDRISLMAFHR